MSQPQKTLSTKTIVTSPNVYKPVGPYSQAILADKTLYVSGVLGMDQQARLVCGGAEAQTRQALENLKHILEAGGSSLQSVVKTTILLSDMDTFQAVNRVYAEFLYGKLRLVFHDEAPSRATGYNWFNEFKRGRGNHADVLRMGFPPTTTTENNLAAVWLMIETDKRLTCVVRSPKVSGLNYKMEDFNKDYPARATYQVAKLPLGAAVEIEAIALSGDIVVAEAGPCPCSN